MKYNETSVDCPICHHKHLRIVANKNGDEYVKPGKNLFTCNRCSYTWVVSLEWEFTITHYELQEINDGV